MVCDVCGLRSPSFQPNSVLYITIINNASLHELVMQGLEEILEKSCFQCKRNTWHPCSQKLLQPPKYVVININRFSYVCNQFLKNRSLAPLGLNFMLGSYAFSLQATLGFSMLSGHYSASVYCCEKNFIATTTKLLCDIHQTKPKDPPPHMLWFINCLWNEFITRTLMMGNIFSHGIGTFCSSHYKYRSKNRRRNLLSGQCVSSQWCLV